MQRNHSINTDYVRAFVRRTEEEAARNLRALERIEATCGALRAMADFTRREARSTYDLAEMISADRSHGSIDPEDLFSASSQRVQDMLAQAVRTLTKERDAAARNPALREDDGVVEAFDDLIVALREFHGTIGELIVAIMEHDADRSPRVGEFTSADDLIAALKG